MAGAFRYDHAELRRRGAAWVRTAAPRALNLHAMSRDLGVSDWVLQRAFEGHTRELWRDERARRGTIGLAALAGQEFASVAAAMEAVATAGRLIRDQVLRLPSGHQEQIRSLVVPGRVERLASTMRRLAALGTFREAFTQRRIEAEARGTFRTSDDDLRREFRHLKSGLERSPISSGDDVIHLHRETLRRSALRADLADIAWDLVQSEHARGDHTDGHVLHRYRSLIGAGELLGDLVPDARHISLAALQQSWYRTGLQGSRRNQARSGLLLILDLLINASTTDGIAEATDLARCSEWLAAMGKTHSRAATRSLTAAESEALVEGCLLAVTRGRERLAADPGLLAASTTWSALDNAAAIVDWGMALALLVGRFTGLRTASIETLQVGELAAIGHETYGVIWRHTKKANPEERLAIVPAPLARLLLEYEEALQPVRTVLSTCHLFVGAGPGGLWSADFSIRPGLHGFARRHLPGLGAVTPALLRRTFATRSLAEGRSLSAVAAQLGHGHIETTLGYTKFERTAHAVETRAALDRYGRIVLERWQTPILLSELGATEQAGIRADADRRNCEVGLCRPGACVMLNAGAPPPCLACQHLVTGPDFFPAWDHEIEARQARITQASAGPDAMLTVAANEAAQLAEIERIYAELRLRAGA